MCGGRCVMIMVGVWWQDQIRTIDVADMCGLVEVETEKAVTV